MLALRGITAIRRGLTTRASQSIDRPIVRTLRRGRQNPLSVVESQSLILASLAEADPITVRTALLGLIALFLLILVCLVVCVILLRRRASQAALRRREASEEAQESDDGEQRDSADQWTVEMAVDDPMACPSCRRELASGLQFCPYDATRLVPAAKMLDHLLDKRQSSRACPRCRRAFDSSLRHCPHDGADLIPMAVHMADCEHEHEVGHSGVGKICPRCQGRYDYGALFCGKDGVELVVLN